MQKPGRIRSKRWVDVALACEEPSTVSEIAGELGVQPGSLAALIRSMEREDLLTVDVGAPQRGRALVLTAKGRDVLDRAVGSVPAKLAGGQRLLVVGEGRTGIPGHVLATLAEDRELLWCARVEGQLRWIGVYSDSSIAVDRTQQVCASAGVPAYAARVDRPLGREAFSAYAQALSGASPAPPLTLGS
jgi:hypothetical protein